MIISLEEAKVFNPKVTRGRLDGIESTIRTVSGNNFQRHAVRLRDVSFEDNRIESDAVHVGFATGQTIQISKSIHNDGLYVVKGVTENGLTVEDHTFFPVDVQGAFATLVIYPPDILSGVIELLRYDAKMADKIGVKSEKISRWSVTYADLERRYPCALLAFIGDNRKLRW